MKHLLKILTILSLSAIINAGCKANMNGEVVSLSETELIVIRDGFDKRVNEAFAAEQGKPLKRASVNPPLNPGRPVYSRGYSWSLVSYATRSFWLNEQIDSANYALIENADFYLADPKRIYDRDNFHWHSEAVLSLIELFGQNGTKTPGLLKTETENKILESIWLYCKRIEDLSSQNRDHTSVADHEISNTWYIYESENHHVQDFSMQWHFAKLAKERANFRDRLYDDGLRAIDHYNQWNDYIKNYLTERAKKGMFIEMMCIGYNTDLIKGVFNFYDFAEDEELKRRAKMFLDLYFTYWGQEQMEGISGGGKSRIYNDTSVGTSGPGYFFFGVGNNPGVKGQLLTAMTTTYRPSLVVVDIVCDTKGRGIYEVIQRPLGLAELNGPPLYKMRTDFGGILRYSYCTPSFIMGTPMVESRPYKEWAAISSQNRSHGVIFKGHHNAAILPQCEKSRADHNAQWSVQRKGTLICQKLKTSKDAGKTCIWFAGYGLSDPTEEKGWVFAESNGAYAALKVADGTFYWKPEKKSVKGKWLVCENDYSPVILEVVQKTDFKTFQEFKNKITDQVIEYENNVLNYKGIYGDLFTFFADFSHSPKINNVTVDYAPSNAFDSPFLQAEWNSGIVNIQKGKRKMVLNFNTQE